MTSPDALAKLLDLDLHDTPICLACLSDVVFAVDPDDAPRVTGLITQVTPKRHRHRRHGGLTKKGQTLRV